MKLGDNLSNLHIINTSYKMIREIISGGKLEGNIVLLPPNTVY